MCAKFHQEVNNYKNFDLFNIFHPSSLQNSVCYFLVLVSRYYYKTVEHSKKEKRKKQFYHIFIFHKKEIM